MYTVYWRYRILRILLPACTILSYLYNVKFADVHWIDWLLMYILAVLVLELLIRYWQRKYHVFDD